MQTKIINKYEGVDINTMNIQELQDYKKRLECDISWIEHELHQLPRDSDHNEKLDEMNLCKNLLNQVQKSLDYITNSNL